MRLKNAIFHPCRWIIIIILAASTGGVMAEEGLQAGFLYDQFDLTLAEGQRTEAVGPFFYSEKKDSECILAVPPLFSDYQNSATENSEFDFLYPLLTYEHYGHEWRWQFFEVLSFAGGAGAG